MEKKKCSTPKDKKKSQTIKCDVESCNFNNSDQSMCELDEIKVSCSPENDYASDKEETICDSYQEKEYEYEVQEDNDENDEEDDEDEEEE